MVYNTKVIEQENRLIVVFDNPDKETREVVKQTFGVSGLIDQLGLSARTPADKNAEEDINKAIELDEHPELKDMDVAIEAALREKDAVPMPIGLCKLLLQDHKKMSEIGIENVLYIFQCAVKGKTMDSKWNALAELDCMDETQKKTIYHHLRDAINKAS